MATLDLAKQFFLIGHDEFSGRPAVSQELVECGVVGALLGELIIEGRLSVKDGRVVVLAHDPVDSSLGDRIVNAVDRQSTSHRVRTWAEELGPDAYRMISDRLVSDGKLRRERSRRLLGQAGERYPAVDLYDATRPRLELNYLIRHREEINLDQAVLASLLTAVGIEALLALDMPRERLRAVINSLTAAMPTPLQELLAGIDETVASIMVTIHR
jgi:Golgi phosphoprotein 3 (GPP34)